MNTDDYIGKPYIAGGAGPAGYDCYGLAKTIAAERGYCLPDQHSDEGVALRMAIFSRRHCRWLVPVDRAEPWSLAVFDHNRLGLHVGTVIDVPGKFIHVSEIAGAVAIERLRNRLYRGPYGFYRLTSKDHRPAAPA